MAKRVRKTTTGTKKTTAKTKTTSGTKKTPTRSKSRSTTKKAPAKKTTTPAKKVTTSKKSTSTVKKRTTQSVKNKTYEYVRVSENAKNTRFVEMGEKVQKGELKWSYYAIDGNVGYHYYRKLK